MLEEHVKYVFDDSSNGDWDKLKVKSTQPAIAYYNEALIKAPNHCGAIFARAIASVMLITQDPKLDAFQKKMDSTNGNAPLFKISTNDAPKTLLKLSANLKNSNPVTLSEMQDLIAGSFLTRLDTAISALEGMAAKDSFEFNFVFDDKNYQIDEGDIGPFLGGLKVAKAWMLVVVGYQWDIAKNGNYDFMDTLSHIQPNDYDHLSAKQIEALDYVTNLFKPGSTFTTQKLDWKSDIQNIPVLLLSAIADAQKGLHYAVWESTQPESQQINDIYKVGTDINSDVDPKDLNRAIDLLERSKKYLTGEVPISYNSGRSILKVNFAKLFQLNGAQNYLPYFTFRPYTEWNDSVRVFIPFGIDDTLRGDTTGAVPTGYYKFQKKNAFYFTDAQGKKTLVAADFDGYSDDLPSLTGKLVFRDPTFGGVFPELTNDNIWININSLGKVHPRHNQECTSDSLQFICKDVLPSNPSDLDLLYDMLNWQNNLIQPTSNNPININLFP